MGVALMGIVDQVLVWAGRTRDIVALRTGAFGDLMDVSVDGYGSRFHIDTYRELWRVRDLVGEREVISHLLSELDEGSTFWDVGANIGTHSCICASKASEVVAFEPNPETRTRLEENAKLAAGSIQTRAEALSNESGEGRLSSTDDYAEGTHEITESGGTRVATARGDDLFGDIPSPDVIKIDVEGHELAALEGMQDVLTKSSHVLVEVHRGVDLEDVQALVSESGLETHLWSKRDGEQFVVGEKLEINAD
ncbi:FkbM family methyltransferase [Halorubrum sp. Atlit-26R]|nr:FkbM family methyltransferase [Halorubrum sp. Atlit-26R]